MRIAFIGFRGIPGTYGGFETLVEHIAPELAGRGHDVTVYCRKAFNTEGLTSYRGTRLITLPAPRSKYLETIVHTAACLPHILASRYDAVIVLNAINAFITLPIRLSPTKIALNVDGIERRRKKWNLLGKLAYMLSEYLATIIPHVTITDAETIQTYYLSRFGKSSTLLTYGGDLCRPDGTGMLEEIDVSPGQYFLYVARFEPENHPEAILRARLLSGGQWPLVMLGSNPYRPGYVEKLKDMAPQNTRFPGARYGESYRQLLFHAGAVVLGFEVGGTHPALVEAMGASRPIMINDTPENREVGGESVIYFDVRAPENLAASMDELEKNPHMRDELGRLARERMESRYTWAHVVDGYETMLRAMVK